MERGTGYAQRTPPDGAVFLSAASYDRDLVAGGKDACERSGDDTGGGHGVSRGWVGGDGHGADFVAGLHHGGRRDGGRGIVERALGQRRSVRGEPGSEHRRSAGGRVLQSGLSTHGAGAFERVLGGSGDGVDQHWGGAGEADATNNRGAGADARRG